MYAALLLPDFALQARLRMTPANSRPHALLEGEGRSAVVASLNGPAQVAGLRTGVSMSLALARCPDLVFLTRSSESEAEATAALHAAAWVMAPTIEDTEEGLVTAQLDGLPVERHEPLALRAIRSLRDLGLTVQIGLAATPLTAALAARRASPLLRVDNAAPFLDPLPLSELRPGSGMVGTLALWGVHSLGDLRRLPLSEVAQRLGRAGAALWDDAGGGAPRPLQGVAQPLIHEASHDCENPVETLEPLLFLLRRLLERLLAELHARHLAAGSATLALRLDDGSRLEREFLLPEPSGNPETLFSVFFSHLQTVRTQVPITGLSLRLLPARPPTLQHGLFDSTLRDPQGFNETVARAAAIVGDARVGTPAPPATHRPDAGVLSAPPPSVPPPENAAGYAPPAVGLPLRRFRPPHPASITFLDTSPAHVSSVPVRGAVLGFRGPWRASGDWWRSDAAWRREEWDVEIDGGGLYRLLRVGEDWFVEGEYD